MQEKCAFFSDGGEYAPYAPCLHEVRRSTQPSVPPGYVNRVPAVPTCLAGVKAGCVHLCRVGGNTVWSYIQQVTLR